MKSKPGTVRFVSFLFSISFCSSIFSQSLSFKGPRPPISITKISLVKATHAFLKPASFSEKVTFGRFLLPIMDTTKNKDRDRDGIADSLDKCPDEKGVMQYDGCPIPDTDNDGVADDSDNCPTVAGLVKYKGCPPPDQDGDKINDEDDKCPTQPGVARYDGCPVGDKDGDGVNDDDDKCITAPGPISNAGCPENNKSSISTRKEKRKKKER